MTTDAAILGACCAMAFVLSTLLWHLYVHPELVLSMFDRDRGVHDLPADPIDPRTLRALRAALGAAVVAIGFLTGAAVAFLSATSP